MKHQESDRTYGLLSQPTTSCMLAFHVICKRAFAPVRFETQMALMILLNEKRDSTTSIETTLVKKAKAHLEAQREHAGHGSQVRER